MLFLKEIKTIMIFSLTFLISLHCLQVIPVLVSHFLYCHPWIFIIQFLSESLVFFPQRADLSWIQRINNSASNIVKKSSSRGASHAVSPQSVTTSLKAVCVLPIYAVRCDTAVLCRHHSMSRRKCGPCGVAAIVWPCPQNPVYYHLLAVTLHCHRIARHPPKVIL